MERDNFESKCERLEQRVIEMDKSNYSLELKARELEDSARTNQRTSLNAIKGQAAGKILTDTQTKRTQLDLKRAEKQIETL